MNEVVGQVTVDLEIFPLPIVKQALYVLSDRVDGRMGQEVDGRLTVQLIAVEGGWDAAEVERAFNRALIAASVNEHAFLMAAPIRNLLAQTAFSITTESQRTIEEFAATLGSRGEDEHAGAPTVHVHVAPEEDDRFTPTAAGNRVMVEEDNGRVVLFIDTRRYLLPDVLWAANEVRDLCTCSISNLAGNQLTVQLKPVGEGMELSTLSREFEHWLCLAVERGRGEGG